MTHGSLPSGSKLKLLAAKRISLSPLRHAFWCHFSSTCSQRYKMSQHDTDSRRDTIPAVQVWILWIKVTQFNHHYWISGSYLVRAPISSLRAAFAALFWKTDIFMKPWFELENAMIQLWFKKNKLGAHKHRDLQMHSNILQFAFFLQPHLRFPTHYWMPDLETATIWHARATVGDHLGIVHSWLLKRPTNQLTSLRGCIFGRRLFYSIRMCVYTTDEMGFMIAYIYQLVWICIAYL